MASSAQEESKKTKQSSAQKRQLQNEKRRVQNKSIKSRLKTTIKDLDSSNEPSAVLQAVFSQVDKAAKKGIVSRNKANRLKSRLARQTQE